MKSRKDCGEWEREEVREGGSEGGREKGREGKREGGRAGVGGREGGRERGREGGEIQCSSMPSAHILGHHISEVLEEVFPCVL